MESRLDTTIRDCSETKVAQEGTKCNSNNRSKGQEVKKVQEHLRAETNPTEQGKKKEE